MGDSSSSEEHKQSGNDNVRELEESEAEIIASPRKTNPSGQKAGQPAGVESTVAEGDDTPMSQDKTMLLGAAKAKGILGQEEVKLPEMVINTRTLFESSLEPCHVEESHAALAVGEHVQPKSSNLLHLASLDSADTLDILAAQPLLAVGHEMNARRSAEPPRTSHQGTEIQIPSPTPLSAFSPYHMEFPPLEKGRILKIRDNFENGMSRKGGNADGPKTRPRDNVQQVTPTNTNASSGEGDVIMGTADGPEGGGNAEIPSQPPQVETNG